MNKIAFIFFVLTITFSLYSCNSQQNETLENNAISKTDIAYVPQWAKEAIWYQIFVERFRNGDSLNDPTIMDIRGTYPDEIPKSWKTTPRLHCAIEKSGLIASARS